MPLFLQQLYKGWMCALLLIYLKYKQIHDKQHKYGPVLEAKNVGNHTDCN